jgi:endonuclease/exonuclease/phosphatase family metal-dependent hydrolase
MTRKPEAEEEQQLLPPKRLRIVTYNIHKGQGLDRRVKIGRIAKILRAIEADVIALQEVLSVEGKRREDHQAQFLAEELEYHYQIGENRKFRGGAYGNVTLSRFPISFSCNYDITQHGREERGCLQTDIRVDSRQTLHIYNLHLGTAYTERRYQAHRLVDHEILKGERKKGARIILGDFNEWIAGLASRLFHSHFHSIPIRTVFGKSRSYPGVLPFLHLDHIYYDGQLELMKVETLRNLRTLIASDHLPVIAEFRLMEEAREGIIAKSRTPE